MPLSGISRCFLWFGRFCLCGDFSVWKGTRAWPNLAGETAPSSARKLGLSKHADDLLEDDLSLLLGGGFIHGPTGELVGAPQELSEYVSFTRAYCRLFKQGGYADNR